MAAGLSMRRIIAIVLLLLGLNSPVHAVSAGAAPAYDPTHAAWTQLLAAHVQWNAAGTATSVDYDGFKRDAGALREYLRSLSSVTPAQFERFGHDEREAFLINAYNAATVQLVLTRYPALESIKDLGGWTSTPWQKPFVGLLGSVRSLDEIEHEMLRGAPDYRDPRIHFALNCASVGCPALRPEAYVGPQLRLQLEDQTRRFLRDRTRNRYDARSGTVWLSRVLDWYSGDFTLRSGSVAGFLARYADALGMDAAATGRLRAGALSIAYFDYDWRLNRRRP